MKRTCDYAIVRVANGAYRLSRVTGPCPGRVADIIPTYDRKQLLTGWRLRPWIMMQGSPSKVWPKASDAIASTKLLKPGEAKAAIATADAANGP